MKLRFDSIYCRRVLGGRNSHKLEHRPQVILVLWLQFSCCAIASPLAGTCCRPIPQCASAFLFTRVFAVLRMPQSFVDVCDQVHLWCIFRVYVPDSAPRPPSCSFANPCIHLDDRCRVSCGAGVGGSASLVDSHPFFLIFLWEAQETDTSILSIHPSIGAKTFPVSVQFMHACISLITCRAHSLQVHWYARLEQTKLQQAATRPCSI